MQSRQAAAHALQAASWSACFSHSVRHLRAISAHLRIISGLHVPDSQWRAHATHSRLQATHARRQASRAGSLARATAHESMQSRHFSAHVQHALSACLSSFAPLVCSSDLGNAMVAIASNPHRPNTTFRRNIAKLLKKPTSKPTLVRKVA